MTDTATRNIPDGAKVELTLLIDVDAWAELEREGYDTPEIQKMIEKSITFDHTRFSAPIHDIEEVKLLKFY